MVNTSPSYPSACCIVQNHRQDFLLFPDLRLSPPHTHTHPPQQQQEAERTAIIVPPVLTRCCRQVTGFWHSHLENIYLHIIILGCLRLQETVIWAAASFSKCQRFRRHYLSLLTFVSLSQKCPSANQPANICDQRRPGDYGQRPLSVRGA